MKAIIRPQCRHVISALLSGSLVFGAVAVAQPTEDLYLANANLVDPTSRQVRVGNLLIRDGIIVGAPEAPPAGFDGRTLDLRGKWVIPGLVDLHAHTHGNVVLSGPLDMPGPAGVAQRMLYAGVTSLLDLFGDEDQLFETRERQRAGEFVGADIFASLSCITAPGGHGTEYGVPARTVTSPEEARSAVADLSLRRPDVIKIIYGIESPSFAAIDRPTMSAAVAAARENGLKTVVHVESWELARDAVEAGATAITHVPQGAVPPELVQLMVARNVAIIPTLTVQTDFDHFVSSRDVLDQPLARQLTTPAVIAAYRTPNAIAFVEGRRTDSESNTASIFESVKRMADAGVTVLAGTDSGSPGTLQGYSVHRELIKLVEAGLSPWHALGAATTEAGVFLGRPYGVTPGSEANLVVLDESPIEDIANTQRIAYVIHHGMTVDREALLESELSGL